MKLLPENGDPPNNVDSVGAAESPSNVEPPKERPTLSLSRRALVFLGLLVVTNSFSLFFGSLLRNLPAETESAVKGLFHPKSRIEKSVDHDIEVYSKSPTWESPPRVYAASRALWIRHFEHFDLDRAHQFEAWIYPAEAHGTSIAELLDYANIAGGAEFQLLAVITGAQPLGLSTTGAGAAQRIHRTLAVLLVSDPPFQNPSDHRDYAFAVVSASAARTLQPKEFRPGHYIVMRCMTLMIGRAKGTYGGFALIPFLICPAHNPPGPKLGALIKSAEARYRKEHHAPKHPIIIPTFQTGR